ncbi:MAG: efflux RND transporter permease subunit [Acetobacteraceae bacterium]
MSISAPFIHRPIATSLVMVAIVLIGLAAYPLLPIAALPNVDFPTIVVSANLPGADPSTMAETVATPLERQLGEIPGVSQMSSVSVQGSTSITVQFSLGRSLDSAAQDIQAAINAAAGQLPKTLPSPPTYRKINPANAPVLIVAVQSDAMPLTVVDEYADVVLSQQISQLPGIAEVFISGAQTPSIHVQADPAKLAAMGLTLEDVRNAILNATVDNPKGMINTSHRAFAVNANDQIPEAANFNNVIIAYRNGAPIRISDIGRAVSGPQNEFLAGWQNGRRGVQLIIFKEPGVNTLTTVDRVLAELPRLEASIPPSIHVSVVVDRSQNIRAEVRDVQTTLVIALCLVVMVVFLFLRSLWATVIPAITIPIALIGTFAMMYVAGYSIDNLSMMGLTIAIGFVVDDAIVMLENIYRHIEDGAPPMQAALKGAGEIGFTIISISASLIAVFLPILLMSGIVGRVFREFAVTVSMAVAVSAFVTLTLTPMMASRFLRHEASHGLLYRLAERGFQGLAGFYQRTLDVALRHRLTTLIVFFATMGLTGYLYIVIPKGFFPPQDTGLLVGTLEGAQAVSFPEMKRLVAEANKIIQSDPAVSTYSVSLGAGIAGQTGNDARYYINLKPFDQRTLAAQQVITRLARRLNRLVGARMFLQAAQDVNVGGIISRTQYQYTLEDANLDELYEWAPKVLAKLQTLPMLRDLATDQQMSGLSATLTIDRDAAARYGIGAAAIDNILDDAFGQREVTQYFTQTNAYYVILEVLPWLQEDLATLNQLYVPSSTGAPVALSNLVHVNTDRVVPLGVNHANQFPAVTLSFNLAENTAIGDAVQAVEQAVASLRPAASLSGQFEGTAAAFQASLSSEPYLIAAAIVAVYLILGILYESYILPLTILSTIPSAGVGALLILLAVHYDLSVIALVGILLLIGIVKKNGILLVDFAITAERRDGKAPLEAIREACHLRFRPILMTTMAAIFTGLPLMLLHGAGSELRRPLGYTMVGGLAVSQVLTLYTTPVVYLYLDRLQHWIAPGRARRYPLLAEKLGSPAD